MQDLNNICTENGISAEKLESYYKKYAIESRLDNAPTIFIKRMLQHVLPENLRKKIISTLFSKYVGISEKELSKKLYRVLKRYQLLLKMECT